MSELKVLIADDHQMLAEMLAQNFDSFEGFECIGTVNNGKELIEKLKVNSAIDIVILDFSMPVIDGLTALKLLQELKHKAKVLVVSSTTNPIRIQKALNLGAMGFVNKSERISVIFEALQTIVKDKVFLSKFGNESIAKLFNVDTGVEYLTSREQEVLELIIEGFDYDKIGNLLFLSPRTIQKHKEKIFTKFEVKNKTELYKKVKELGWE